MQLFPCPFCGPRSESEFHYAGEAGNIRPEGYTEVSGEAWANYLYMRSNAKGDAGEVWVHRTCREFFVMKRDSLTHEVFASMPLGHATESSDTLPSGAGPMMLNNGETVL
jgi:heterotetrameric sarcosine oxidase delta subunit